MAHILHRFGAAALLARRVEDKVLPPLVGFEEAMKLRQQFYGAGQVWPYEHIVPGPPQPPKGVEIYLERQQQRAEKRAKRVKEIQDALAKMPQLIAEYKASRRLDWSEVTPLDRLTLTNGQIREKYVRRRLAKQ